MRVPRGRALLAAAAVVLLTACTAPASDRPPDTGAELVATSPVSGHPGGAFGFGRPATEADIAAWDIDVGPDGAGLPAGRGTVREGLRIYEEKCVACHGATGTEGPYDVLAGRIPGDAFPFATDGTARSTVGSYWPYATTLFDYTRRAMPFDFPGSLSDDEVYSVVGAVLYLNDLLAEEAVVDSATLTDLVMPARDRFVTDDRAGGPEVR